MTRLEMVEKIREKTGVTYEEAREALEKANWDMLDAVVAIEKEHPAKDAGANANEAKTENINEEPVREKASGHARSGEVGDKIAGVLKWIGALIKKGENSHLEVVRKEETVMELSMVILILLFLVNWWIPAILIVVGLFTGYKFRVSGKGAAGRIVNSVSEKASAAADEIVSKLGEEETEE